MQNVKNTIIDWLLNTVAPHLCSSCGKIGTLFCDDCKSYIKQVPLGECWVCGVRTDYRLCHQCHALIDNIRIVGLREGALQMLIGGFKFRYMRAAASDIAMLLAPLFSPGDILVPLPTQPSHVRVRGYDHTALIAWTMHRRHRVPTISLLATEASHTQHRLSRRERIVAARRSVSVVRMPDPHHRYVLFDDIITTGATVLQAARALRAAGVRHLLVVALARQPSTKCRSSVKIGKIALQTVWRGDRAV